MNAIYGIYYRGNPKKRHKPGLVSEDGIPLLFGCRRDALDSLEAFGEQTGQLFRVVKVTVSRTSNEPNG